MKKTKTAFGLETLSDDGSIQFAIGPISPVLNEAFEILRGNVFTIHERLRFMREFMTMDDKTAQDASKDLFELLRDIRDFRLSE